MSFTTIEVSTSAHLTQVTINRPQARNSLTLETTHELTQAFTQLTDSKDARCVLLTGAGSEAFCAGADLKGLLDNPTPDARRAFFESIATLIETIEHCPVPVVAAVHGFALAGGCGLVAACDIAIASEDAIFGLPEVGIGLAPMVVMAPLSRTIPRKALSLMALTGERLSAVQALAAGLVTMVVPKSELAARVHTICRTIQAQGPDAVRATKATLRDLAKHSGQPLIDELADRSALLSLGAEAAEGIAAFQEKRAPSWRS
jgi:enoyl-CoA hydratase/carnithine racemase